MFVDKNTGGPAIVHHGQVAGGKQLLFVPFDDHILLKKLAGSELQMPFQPENIIRRQGQVQFPAAFGETGDSRMTGKFKRLICG